MPCSFLDLSSTDVHFLLALLKGNGVKVGLARLMSSCLFLSTK